MAGLTGKQRAFIEEYLKCWNATEAARRAGYQGNRGTLGSVGSENLAKPAIRACIDKRLKELNVGSDKIPEKRTNRKAIFVYLIRAANDLVKIGKTVDVQARLKSLSWASPVELDLLGFIESELADELEDRLHAEFADKRVRGEWFALEEEDIRNILSRYG